MKNANNKKLIWIIIAIPVVILDILIFNDIVVVGFFPMLFLDIINVIIAFKIISNERKSRKNDKDESEKW